jgi:GLPGLI family protein
MKIVLLLAASIATLFATAQPKVITQAIITTSTNVIAPEDDEDVSQIQPQGREGGNFNFRTMMDGETKSTTYIKDNMVKTDMKSETYKGSIFRDNDKKLTTTVFEIMGSKQGFYASDDDQANMKKRMDSMRDARMKADTNMKERTKMVDPTVSVSYINETKKIAGYTCKKAFVITDRIIKKDTTIVWYNPDIKFSNLSSTGGTSGFGMMSAAMSSGVNFDKVDGFVMEYMRKMPRGRTMEVKVTKIIIDKEIAVKEFDIPKDVEIKSAKDMMGSGNVRMFGGGRPQ